MRRLITFSLSVLPSSFGAAQAFGCDLAPWWPAPCSANGAALPHGSGKLCDAERNLEAGSSWRLTWLNYSTNHEAANRRPGHSRQERHAAFLVAYRSLTIAESRPMSEEMAAKAGPDCFRSELIGSSNHARPLAGFFVPLSSQLTLCWRGGRAPSR